jgi:hypothetical protein
MDATVAIGRYTHIHKLAMLAENNKTFVCFDNRTGSYKQPETMDHVQYRCQCRSLFN